MPASRSKTVIPDPTLLVINCGSSSVKFALFDDADPGARRLWSGAIERIGVGGGRFYAHDERGKPVVDETRDFPDHAWALHILLETLAQFGRGRTLRAVGHRVVHGGADCDCALPVDDALLARLRRLIPLAPLHLPHNLAGIAAVRSARPGLAQFACFDTAFHHGMARPARLTGLPRAFADEGIVRYGFHGLSYEYVMNELRRRHGGAVAEERIVIAHLGNGASMAAIRGGRSVDTTMGFSTLAGLTMGTRSGDLDPGIVLHLLIDRGMTAEQIRHLLYEESGLLGLSGQSRNMQELLALAGSDEAAAEAIEFFCYQARKHLAALTAPLGGLDRLVFTGGIGANAAEIRARICADLDFLGIALDAARNADGAQTISAETSAVAIEAFATDEESVIAGHVRRLLADQPVAPGA
jgi:acetate kinase